MTISEQLTREYLEKYPTTSKLAIARLLFRDHPLIFNSVENARTRVRYYTHAMGNYSRKSVKEPISRMPSSA